MTPDAKGKLAKTIRALRAQLLADYAEAVEREYRLSIPAEKAKLTQEMSRKRARLEDWIGERQRAEQERAGKKKGKKSEKLQESTRSRLIDEVVQEAGYTLLNRLVYLRILEGTGLRSDKLIAKGWSSTAYQDFRELAAALTSVESDETEGYAFLLQLVFDELAVELPGLFGDVGLTTLVPVPPATLRSVVEALEDEELESCWVDDTCLGWVYQYWNDPQREALDDKVKDRGKIEPWEIASKTQLFTERYMALWLLQNSIGKIWLSICEKHGWIAHALADGTIDALEKQRSAWRERRESGSVKADAMMPVENDQQERWKYWVRQPLPSNAASSAPKSLRDLKLLDPACGSGHLLVLAFDLLVPLYQEEALHRGESWPVSDILKWILEDNLHGIDIDPRAAQITAASLMLKAKRHIPQDGNKTQLQIKKMRILAPTFHLSSLNENDPTIQSLSSTIERDTGIAPELTTKMIMGLRGADYLGSLLMLDSSIAKLLSTHAQTLHETRNGQASFAFLESSPNKEFNQAQATELVLAHLDSFLATRSSSNDLGIRLAGQQIASGLEFSRMVRDESYDLVVANPPYQGAGKLADSSYITKHYLLGKADLYSAFMERGMQLIRAGGICGMVTLSNWMFLKTFADLRKSIIERHSIWALADFGKAAFSTGGTLISSSCVLLMKSPSTERKAVAIRPHAPDEVNRDDGQPARTRAALLLQRARFEFDPKAFSVIPESPLVYWWSAKELQDYAEGEPLISLGEIRAGGQTGNNSRFLRLWFELQLSQVFKARPPALPATSTSWVPYIKGASGLAWYHPLKEVVYWKNRGLSLALAPGANTTANRFFFRGGVAFTSTGNIFRARIHYYSSAIDIKGQSQFTSDCALSCASLNSTKSQRIIADLNPTVSFQPGDAKRLPVFQIESTGYIFEELERSFEEEERRREASIEFTKPGPSTWRRAQAWAQRAVDRANGEPLPDFRTEVEAEAEAESGLRLISFYFGTALGRFGENGEGVLDPTIDSHSDLIARSLPGGILFLDGSIPTESVFDGNQKQPTHFLREAWSSITKDANSRTDLSTYLRTKYFTELHRKTYDNRPIYWPLSSQKKTYVAWMSIHRTTSDSLRFILAEKLIPRLHLQNDELDDLRIRKETGTPRERRAAEKRYSDLHNQHLELQDFIEKVQQCAEKGPPPPDGNTPARELDAPYNPNLDDGVMINSAALWPLLEPQWKDPKKWWKELATAKGRKDYDWSHLAKRYFPTRVEKKCQEDPSLAVAHGCFWKYHPEKAYAWELRLQDEIKPDFTIDEQDSDTQREAFLKQNPDRAEQIRTQELARRKKSANKEQRVHR